MGEPRIVINPDVMSDRRAALTVAWNEALRYWMEKTGFEPKAEPTGGQRSYLSGTAYESDELMLRRTLTARIATLDASVPDYTPEQEADALAVLKGAAEDADESERATLAELARLVGEGFARTGREPEGGAE